MTSVPEWTWTAPGGATRVLTRTNGAYLAVGGVVGHMAAPSTHLASTPPTLDGGIYRSRKVEPRDIALRLNVSAASPHTWGDLVRQVVNEFDTSDGPGTLQMARLDGTRRYINCHYLSGLESPEGGDPGAIPFGTFTVLLRAYDPWWYGETQSRTFTVSSSTDLFGASGAPDFYIMPTELVGSGSTVNNPGDVDAYPTWTINGPMTSATFTLDTGDTFTITNTLSAGESIIVSTDPRTPAFSKILNDGGSNLWGTATTNYPNLWALPAGDSTVTVSIAGSTSSSSVLLEFMPRYRTA